MIIIMIMIIIIIIFIIFIIIIKQIRFSEKKTFIRFLLPENQNVEQNLNQNFLN